MKMINKFFIFIFIYDIDFDLDVMEIFNEIK